MRLLIAIILALTSAAHAFAMHPAQDATKRLAVHVDERVELMALVARLAGADEYRTWDSKSPYAERVYKHFGPFENHAAIKAFQSMRASHGVSHDAVMFLAVHLDAVPSLDERIPFDRTPPRLDKRWALEPTRAFLAALRDFAKASDAHGFFAREQAFYANVESRLSATIADAKAVEWFDAFLGAKAGAGYTIIPGLLCGSGSYGVGVQFTDGRPEEITPVLGCGRWDESGVPTFGADVIPLLVHELCHSYTNPLVDRHLDALRPAGELLFPGVAAQMRRQAYSDWKIMMYETIVRACVVRFMRDRFGADAAEHQAKIDASRGFTWVGELATFLDGYANDRVRAPTLDAFMPEVAAFLERRAREFAAEAKARAEKAPKLVSIEPANGAADITAGEITITIRFDKPMQPRGWSFVGAKTDMPAFITKPAFDAGGTTFTVRATFEAGRSYRFSLNGERFRNFKSADGGELEPLDVRWNVRP